MKTIIAATDFSASAQNAVQYAAELAAQTNAKLIIFNAFQLSLHASNSLISAAGFEEMFQSNKKRLDILADTMALQYGINAEAHSINAFLLEALQEGVHKLHADLVVMGMHINDWGDKMFGNTTISIIINASYPLLIVPEKASFNGISKILYAFDNKSVASQNKLFMLRDIAESFAAEVQVFHVETEALSTPTEKVGVPNLKVEAALANVEHSYKDVESKNIAASIEKELEVYNADLLAVVPHRTGLLNRLLNKSITRQLALEAPIPFLVLPNDSLNEE